MKSLALLLDIASEINLAIFYLKGIYYDLVKRMLGVRQVGLVFWG
jgi:peroxin-10